MCNLLVVIVYFKMLAYSDIIAFVVHKRELFID